MAAQLCGRHAECVETLQRAFHAACRGGRPRGGLPLRLPSGHALHRGRRARPGLGLGRAGAAAAGGDRAGHPRGGLRRAPADVPPPGRGRLSRGHGVRRRGAGRRPPLRRPRPDRDRARRGGAAGALLRPGDRGAGALRRGAGRGRRGRGLARLRGSRLLRDDRGLPGRLRPRAGGGVDERPEPLGRGAAGAGRLHRPVRGAPRPDLPAARRLPRSGRRVRRRHRALPGRDHDGSGRAGLRRAGRRAAHPRRARRGRREL